MNEATKEYLKQIAEYEENVFGYAEKIAFRDKLIEIITMHYNVLTIEEIRNAEKLLDRIQKEILMVNSH